MPICRGSFRALLLFDISEEIDLAEVRRILGAAPPGRSPGFKRAVPVYVRFERPPVEEPCEPIRLATGEMASARLRYFDYGAVSLEAELQFESDWPGLIALANRWIEAGEVEQSAQKHIRDYVARICTALRKPYPDWLDEVYYVVHLREVVDDNGAWPTGAQLIANYGCEISQVIRGETMGLSEAEQREVLASSISYYPNDLMVVGWLAALVYDTPEGAAPMI